MRTFSIRLITPLVLGLLLNNCAEPYYLPTVVNPIALEEPRQWVANSSFGMLGFLPMNGVDVQLAYSPRPHLGVGINGTYYHPFEDSRWKAGGDLILGGYGRLSDAVHWRIYGLAGRSYAFYYPERLRTILNPGMANTPPPAGVENGSVELTLNRYAIWPSLRITDAAGMSFELGGRVGILGIERIRLTAPLRDEDVALHRTFSENTPFPYLDFFLAFQLSERGPYRINLTGVFNAPPEGFPNPSLSVLLGFTYWFGTREE
jgi:hypothetical protein